MFVSRDVFTRVGGFTENYSMYGEDLDLCFKIKQAGYRVYHTGETNIIHHGSGSSRQDSQTHSDVIMRERTDSCDLTVELPALTVIALQWRALR